MKLFSYDITWMEKSKPKKKSSKKKPTKFHAFFLGVIVGLTLFWIPFDELSFVQFSKNEWPTQTVESLFDNHLPVTAPLLQREGHVLAYNGQTRNPYWVYHKLTETTVETKINRDEFDFREDTQIPELIRATKADYHLSGYDRGHLCPAADCETPKGMENSFLLSNISPQLPPFNRGIWKKLEQHIRDLTKQYRVVHTFTGPLYLSHVSKNGKKYVKYEVIGKQEVAVPTHFFTLIFVELPSGKILSKAYILPNKGIDPHTQLKKFSVSVNEVEKASGVLFTKILD